MIVQCKWICRLLRINGITLFPFIIVKDKEDKVLVNHERIHLRQQRRYWIIPFYFIYLLDYVRFGYWGIRFEKEAYENEKNLNYRS